MNWNELKALDQLEEIKKESAEKLVLIFKHSTRCNVSRMQLDRLERQWQASALPNVSIFYLDLIRFRDISNAVAEMYNVEHHSPQVLLISNGKSVLDLSHFEIEYDAIRKSVLKNSAGTQIQSK